MTPRALVVWWAGVWLAPLALFAVACWRAPDPERVRVAVGLLAAALVLALTAVAVLIQCTRGACMTSPPAPCGRGQERK